MVRQFEKKLISSEIAFTTEKCEIGKKTNNKARL